MKKSVIMQALGASAGRAAVPSQESHGDVVMLAYECEQLSHQITQHTFGLENEVNSMELLHEAQDHLDGLIAAMEHLADEPTSKGARAVRILLREQMSGYGIALPSMEDADAGAQHQADTNAGKSTLTKFVEAAKAFAAKIIHHLRMIFDLKYRRQKKLEKQFEQFAEALKKGFDEALGTTEEKASGAPASGKYPFGFTGGVVALLHAFHDDPAAIKLDELGDTNAFKVMGELLTEFTNMASGKPSLEQMRALNAKFDAMAGTSFGGHWKVVDRTQVLALSGGQVKITLKFNAGNISVHKEDYYHQTRESDHLLVHMDEAHVHRALDAAKKVLAVNGQLLTVSAISSEAGYGSKWVKAIGNLGNLLSGLNTEQDRNVVHVLIRNGGTLLNAMSRLITAQSQSVHLAMSLFNTMTLRAVAHHGIVPKDE